MKKITLLQTGCVAVCALAVGLFIGLWITGVFPAGDSFSGTFAKADRFRKVSITEQDIVLRNDLLGDTASLTKYQKYLSYYYFKSLQTSVDLEKVMAKTANEADFNQSNYAKALAGLNTYLETARVNLLKGVALLKTLKESKNQPLRDDLTNAMNTISRINNQNRILLDFLGSVETYLASHADQPHQALKDAYDLLTVNVMQTALITRDRPLLKYLGEMKFFNDLNGMKVLLTEVQLSADINAKVVHDKADIIGLDEVDIQQIIVSINKLDKTLGGEMIFSQIGVPLHGAIPNNAGKYALPDLGEIIRIQNQVVQTFAVTEMQGIFDQALSSTCKPYCVGN